MPPFFSFLKHLGNYREVLPIGLRNTWHLLGGTIFRSSHVTTKTIDDGTNLGGYTWSDYHSANPQAKLLIEAAALQAAFRHFAKETVDITISIDSCAEVLHDNNEFRQIFLRCWEEGDLQELHSNDIFQFFMEKFSSISKSDSSLPHEEPRHSVEQHITKNSRTTGNKSPSSSQTPHFALLSNDGFERMETYWPRRLLHISTLTSIERTGQDTYGDIKRPKYCILTYTWGRWERDRPGPTLEVKGTPWKIPSIEEGHFTVEAFRKVVQRMGQEVEWAWIDVACIEQSDGSLNTKSMKMDETSRQIGIFKNAHRVFAWLSHLSTGALETHLEDMRRYGLELNVYKKSQFSLETILRKLDESLSAILADPWFSSLWTLQEIVLRTDAVILAQEGNPIQGGLNMISLARNYNNIRERLIMLKGTDPRWAFPDSPDSGDLASKIISAIDRAGFPYYSSSNPNAQYSLAQYRVTTRPLDRIYGIMQIYNLRIGEAIDPSENPTLDDLEDEFTAAICRKCPILSQRFIHLKRPPKGKAWRISQFSAVPDRILRYKNPKPSCTIHPHSQGHAIFRGKICLLHALEQLWDKFMYENPQPWDFNAESPFEQHFEVILDRHALRHHPVHRDTARYSPPPAGSRSAAWRIAQDLYRQYGTEEVILLELGTLWSEFQYYSQKTQDGVSAPEHFGIIVRPVTVDGRVGFERLAVCAWNPLAAFGEAGESFDEGLRWKEQCEVILV